MADKADHLRLRIPGRGELTLSMPDGVLRALRDNRLPPSAEAWHAESNSWVALTTHPAVDDLLQSMVPQPSTRPPPPAPVPDPAEAPSPLPPPLSDESDASPAEFLPVFLDFGKDLEDETVVPTPPLRGADSAVISPANVGEIEGPQELKLVYTPPPETDRAGLEGESPVLRRSPASPRPDAAETPEPVFGDIPLEPPGWLSRGKPTPGRLLALLGVGAVLVAGFIWYRASTARSAPPAAPRPDQAGDSSALSPSIGDSASPIAGTRYRPPRIGPLPLQGVSGGPPEADLETRLRLADALVWETSDFASAEQIVRSVRKVDAVRNSIEAYRNDMRRLTDSARPAEGSPRRLEPFDEASRIDEVLAVMQAALKLLDRVQGRFRIRGELLVFDRQAEASRYNDFLKQADSLLQARVPMDPNPLLRPPRRIVTRLLETLPVGAVLVQP